MPIGISAVLPNNESTMNITTSKRKKKKGRLESSIRFAPFAACICALALAACGAPPPVDPSVDPDNAGNLPPEARFNIKNPYTASGYWYVGQIHFHTTNSDGVDPAQQMERLYWDAGYDFVVSTDHRGFYPYFGATEDGLTPDPDNSPTGKDLLWIRGSELGYGSVHMGAWGYTNQVPMLAGDDPQQIQERIDHVRSNGGLVALNHPHNEDPPYAWDWSTETRKVSGYSFVEAFNGKHALSNDELFELNHTPTAIDLADEFQQIWWVGGDDCHDSRDPRQFNRYAIVVKTDSPTISQQDILAAADSGNMYVRQTAQGPALNSAKVDGNTIAIELADVNSLYDVIWRKRGGEIVQENLDVDTAASYAVVGNEGYVRAEIKRKDDDTFAYTQPFFIANNVDLSSSVSVSSGSSTGANLIDNDFSTFWDAQANTASFVIDVGAVKPVNAVKINWYAVGIRRFNYMIETSETGAFAGEQKLAVRETYNNRSANTLDFFDEVARYIRVTATSQSVGVGNSIRINEVQVFDSTPARTQLYISNLYGNDGSSGFSGSPWRTFNHAKNQVRPRDTLNFMNTGTAYTENMDLTTKQSGKNRYTTIIFQGDPTNLTQLDASGLYSGVSISGSSFVEWMYFDIHSASTANMLVSETANEIDIRYNRLHGSLDKGFMGSGKFRFTHNLVYGNGREGAIVYKNGTDATLYNNVFYGNGTYGLIINSASLVAQVMNNIAAGNTADAMIRGTMGTVTDGYNCVQGPSTGPWQRTRSLDVNPLFVGPGTGDFRLQAGSPCIDAGIDVGLSADFQGNPPYDARATPNTGNPGDSGRNYIDIGAHEYID